MPSSSLRHISFGDCIPGLPVLACRLLAGGRNSNSQPSQLNSSSYVAFWQLFANYSWPSQPTSTTQTHLAPLGSALCGSSHCFSSSMKASSLAPICLSDRLASENCTPISPRSGYSWQPSLDSNDPSFSSRLGSQAQRKCCHHRFSVYEVNQDNSIFSKSNCYTYATLFQANPYDSKYSC